ncbi:MAG: 50S ribosomal protein L17 [Bacteroidales bacterium]|nr:50S ribosomal protein L17 [Bacteroidales bacterium]
MRHGCKVNKLSRTHAHRVAMLSNMASSLILHKRINTTMAKAKALRGYVEPLITKTKADSTHQRRVVFSYLQNKEAVKELFGDVAAKVANRNGGYTRILKLGRRLGDGAEMVMMELVDYNEAMLKDTAATKKAKTTRRGGKKKATSTEEVAAPAAAETEATTEQSAE